MLRDYMIDLMAAMQRDQRDTELRLPARLLLEQLCKAWGTDISEIISAAAEQNRDEQGEEE